MKRLLRSRLWVSSLLYFSACTVGPDYRQPFLNHSERWRSEYGDREVVKMTHETALNPKDLPWWEVFGDSLLTALIAEAVAGNLDYQQALARVKQARSALSVAESGVMPAILGKGLYTHNHPSKTVGQGNGSQQGDIFQVGLDVSWQLDLFGGLRRAAQEKKALEEGAIAHSRAVLLTVIADVAQTYVNYRQAQQKRLLQERVLGILEQQEKQQADLARSGLTTILEQQQTRAARAEAEAALKAFDTAQQTALYQLSVLLGKEPKALTNRLRAVMPIPTVKTKIFIDLPSTVLKQRPDVIEAERRLAASTAAVGVAVADLFPVFNLTGAFAFRGTTIHNVISPKSSYVSAGPGITLPIFSFGAIQAHINGQKALQEEAYLVYKQVVLSALQEVESALVSFVNAQSQVDHLTQAVASQEIIWQMVHSRFQAGLDSIFNAHQARLSLITAQQKQLDATATVSLEAIRLYKALGGGHGFI